MKQKNSLYKIINTGDSSILYDEGVIAAPSLALFDHNQASISSKKGVGRAKVKYFQHDGKMLVLKHYFRGGMVARFIKDKYLGVSNENTRAFKEWRLLKLMQQFGLPVPIAVAAHVEKHFLCFRADLITVEIEQADTLADHLAEHAIDTKYWRKVGECIRKFHQKNIYHADLNARNILLDDSNQVYLIDFDNSCVRQSSDKWKMENLARLKRSLMKFKSNSTTFYFDDSDWSALLLGYKSL